ncbi:PEP-CTERM sorting domain-containing protein [Oceanicoccus sagamiensis]|uniref:Ice-binding protein C-terminal domain-containing protein n=1 Tax=Oceanicoccus sagamiensis TaxID=716816 RepID=A0A1X9NGJ0_9GAMM|nr:PEP-CTERM sorting domain-containing protein [Oceanicoccus sagamiensis]ARN74965.1 hypothetical protein BST96_13070 [Oceanicoccus sagamiensis]
MFGSSIKKLFLLGLAQACIGLSAAQAVVIDDNYIGAADDPFTDWGIGRDVLGGNIYEVYGMEVTFTETLMTVTVNTDFIESHEENYDNYIAGDLFISTDGWSPFGSAANAYMYDDSYNGEDWEFAYDSSAGVVIEISNPGYIDVIGNDPECCRHGQETMVEGYLASDITNAGVSYTEAAVATSGLGGVYDYTYVINYEELGIMAGDELGLHWVMSCGNDVIEGMVTVPSGSNPTTGTVPEPGSLVLLAIGVVALVVTRRKPA